MITPENLFDIMEPTEAELRISNIFDWRSTVALHPWFRLVCFDEIMLEHGITTDNLERHVRDRSFITTDWKNYIPDLNYSQSLGWSSFGKSSARELVTMGRQRQPLTLPQAIILVMALQKYFQVKGRDESVEKLVKICPALYRANGFDLERFDFNRGHSHMR